MAINVKLKNNIGEVLHPQTSAGLVTGLQTFVKGEISKAKFLKFLKVDALPSDSSSINETTIYLVKKDPNGTEHNVLNEFLYIEGKWELIGDTAVSLEGYATETWVEENFVSDSTFVTELAKKADIATDLKGYGITDAVSDSEFEDYKKQVAAALDGKADIATDLKGYGITDAVSDSEFEDYKKQVAAALDGKVSDSAFTTYQGEVTTALGNKVENSAFTTYQGEVTAALDGKVSDSAFDTYKEQVTDTIEGINDTLKGLISYVVIGEESESYFL